MAICGIANTTGLRLLAEQLVAMVSALNNGNVATHAKFVSQEAGIGITSAFESDSLYVGNGLRVVCDAEIYNREELQKTLPVAEPASIAALLAALYQQSGEDFINKLEGVFSLAMWDEREQRLLLARDRL